MLKKIIQLFSRSRKQTADDILKYPKSRRIYSDSHSIRKTNIDPDALKVVQRLQQTGYKAYIVGGSVRDLLLGRSPKDFDVVTNASPNAVKRVFANSRVIGRRFKIVHVVFRGNKIIEVSTARSIPESRSGAKEADDLYLEKDNQFGSFKDDAARRDFTINALFYDTRNETIIDYTGGFEDLQDKIIRIIGDEDISLPEDPVRMLRAVKFASILDFELTPRLLKGIKKHRKLILKASRPRMHEEYNKIFRTGQTDKVFALMHTTGLLEAMFPTIAAASFQGEAAYESSAFSKRLQIADRMISEHEDINTTLYYLLVLADLVRPYLGETQNRHENSKNLRESLTKAEEELGLTKRETERIIQILESQFRFSRDVKDRKGWVKEFMRKEHFLESFIFFKILARSENNEEAIQKAFFWEIGLRKKLPQAIRKSSAHRSPSPRPIKTEEA